MPLKQEAIMAKQKTKKDEGIAPHLNLDEPSLGFDRSLAEINVGKRLKALRTRRASGCRGAGAGGPVEDEGDPPRQRSAGCQLRSGGGQHQERHRREL